MCFVLVGSPASVCGDDGSVEEAGIVACEEEGYLGDFVGFAHSGVDGHSGSCFCSAHGADVFHAFGDVGHDCAGADGVAADALVCVHVGGVFGESDEGVLGAGVGHAGSAAVESSDGGGVDDVSSALGEHLWDDFSGEHHGAVEVDGHDFVPGFVGYFSDGFHVVHDSGVVDEDVDFSFFGDDFVDDGFYLLFVGDVGCVADDVSSVIFDFFYCLVESVFYQIDGVYNGAFLGE